MAKKYADTTIGIDLLGTIPSAVSIRSSSKGIQLLNTWASTPDLRHQVGGMFLTPSDGWAPGSAEANAVFSIGAQEITQELLLRPTDIKTPGEVWARHNTLSEVSHGLDQSVKFAVPFHRPADGTWGYQEIAMRTATVMQSIDWVQNRVPTAHPLIDSRITALMRVMQAFAHIDTDAPVLLSHVDLWDTVHILYVNRAPRVVHLREIGVARLAAAHAQETESSVEDAFAAVLRGTMPSAALATFARTMDEDVATLRSKLSDMASASQDPSARDAARVRLPQRNVATIERWLISGPLADLEGVVDAEVHGLQGAARERFRPLLDCLGSPVTARQADAGRFTIALGHALNVRGTRDFTAMPLDFTQRMPTELLSEARREAVTVVQVKRASANARARPTNKVQKESTINVARIRTPMYLVAAAILVVGLGLPNYQERGLDRDISRLEADTIRAAEQVMNITNLQKEASMIAAKRHAFEQIGEVQHQSQRVLAATARAMGHTPREVWLTGLSSLSPTEIRYEGLTHTPVALASYLDGLRAESLFVDLQLDNIKRKAMEANTWTFQVHAFLKPFAPLLASLPLPGPSPIAPAGGIR